MKKLIFVTFLFSISLISSASYPKPTLSGPRDTMNYFLKTMKGHKQGDPKGLDLALKALDLSSFSEQTKEESGKLAAQKLINSFDRLEYINVKKIPNSTKSGQWVYLQKNVDVNGVLTPVIIEIEKSEGDQKWRFSSRTLSTIHWLEVSLMSKDIVRGVIELKTWKDQLKEKMPGWMKKEQFALYNWQWVGLLFIIVVAFIIERIFQLYIASLLIRFLKRKNISLDEKTQKKFTFPLGLLAFTTVWYFLIPQLEFNDHLLSWMIQGSTVAFTFAIALGVYQFVDLICYYLEKKAIESENKFDDILVPLIRKSAKTFVVAVGLVAIGDSLNLDMKGLLAGMGIAGLGISLAAKDTISNLFGSLTILLDRPFRIGDWVVIDNGVEGIVEEVGLRSCRIRTFYDSVVTLPNGGLTNTHIDNYGQRTYRRYSTKIGIEYSTPPEKIEAFCQGIKDLINTHPHTRKDYYHVYLNSMGASAIEILLYVFWHVPDWSEELKERERLLLDIIRLAKKLEVEFAFPTQTLHVASLPDS